MINRSFIRAWKRVSPEFQSLATPRGNFRWLHQEAIEPLRGHKPSDMKQLKGTVPENTKDLPEIGQVLEEVNWFVRLLRKENTVNNMDNAIGGIQVDKARDQVATTVTRLQC